MNRANKFQDLHKTPKIFHPYDPFADYVELDAEHYWDGTDEIQHDLKDQLHEWIEDEDL